MKKIFSLIIGAILILCFSSPVFSGEKKDKEKEVPKGAKVNVEKLIGEIVDINTNLNTITVKQADGSQITLKIITPEMMEEIKNFSVGEKVKILFIPKENELILFKIKKYTAEEGKKKKN